MLILFTYNFVMRVLIVLSLKQRSHSLRQFINAQLPDCYAKCVGTSRVNFNLFINFRLASRFLLVLKKLHIFTYKISFVDIMIWLLN